MYVFVPEWVSAPSVREFARPRPCPRSGSGVSASGLGPVALTHVALCTLERQAVSLHTRLGVCVCGSQSLCQWEIGRAHV